MILTATRQMQLDPYVLILVPNELTTEEVYFYLVNTPEGREEIFRNVEERRFSSWESVFVIHPSIPYPFLFTPFLSDETFVIEINARLDVLLDRST